MHAGHRGCSTGNGVVYIRVRIGQALEDKKETPREGRQTNDAIVGAVMAPI